ncbi:hypothetical protein NPIL_398521 [Nephila pilipes]|uniref:Uncharacterized protein n=1 Tax=Nephila pilipes TaxID=299642 RepID=A0A8X6T287_NEPPI|nr:hypothetical protein NPIL_398521 [Nephila pilipes]
MATGLLFPSRIGKQYVTLSDFVLSPRFYPSFFSEKSRLFLTVILYLSRLKAYPSFPAYSSKNKDVILIVVSKWIAIVEACGFKNCIIVISYDIEFCVISTV